MPIKNVTPAKGAQTRSVAKKQAAAYQPKFKSDKPQPRSKGGRGNEQVTNDDVSRVAEQSLTPQAQEDRWARVPNAIEYLRRYCQHLEQQVLNEKKTLTPMSALKLMDLLYRFHEQIGDMIKSPASKLYDKTRFVVVPEVFGDNDTTTLTLEGIGRCNILDDIQVAMVGDNKVEQDANRKKFYQWLIDNQLEDMLTKTVNAQTLSAFVRRQIKDKDGMKLPYDLIKVNPVTRAQITRG